MNNDSSTKLQSIVMKPSLKFGESNYKLDNLIPKLRPMLRYIGNNTKKPKLITFSKLSGYQCPFAKLCLSKAVVRNGKRTIEDGPHTQFRCFSASQEVLFTNVYNHRKHNTDVIGQLGKAEEISSVI